MLAPPPGADPTSVPQSPAAQISGRASFLGGDLFDGQLSLGMLAAIIVALLAFYYWTRNAQGGG